MASKQAKINVFFFFFYFVIQSVPEHGLPPQHALSSVWTDFRPGKSREESADSFSPQTQEKSAGTPETGESSSGGMSTSQQSSVQEVQSSAILNQLHLRRGGTSHQTEEDSQNKSTSNADINSCFRSVESTPNQEHSYAAPSPGSRGNPILLADSHSDCEDKAEENQVQADREKQTSQQNASRLNFPFKGNTIRRHGRPLPPAFISDPFGAGARSLPPPPTRHWNPARAEENICGCNGCWFLRIEFYTQRRGYLLDRIQQSLNFIHSIAKILHNPIRGWEEQVATARSRLVQHRHAYYENENTIREVGNERFCSSVYWRSVSEALRRDILPSTSSASR